MEDYPAGQTVINDQDIEISELIQIASFEVPVGNQDAVTDIAYFTTQVKDSGVQTLYINVYFQEFAINGIKDEEFIEAGFVFSSGISMAAIWTMVDRGENPKIWSGASTGAATLENWMNEKIATNDYALGSLISADMTTLGIEPGTITVTLIV